MTPTHPLDRLRVGMRAVVRHRLADGLNDALGEVVALDESSVSVATRRGLQVVRRAAVVAAKEVPPAPSRRGAPHLAVSMADLQRVMVDGWPPLERASLGGWMLRAAGGFTGRANSVLPLGDPGLPLPEPCGPPRGGTPSGGSGRCSASSGPRASRSPTTCSARCWPPGLHRRSTGPWS